MVRNLDGKRLYNLRFRYGILNHCHTILILNNFDGIRICKSMHI